MFDNMTINFLKCLRKLVLYINTIERLKFTWCKCSNIETVMQTRKRVESAFDDDKDIRR